MHKPPTSDEAINQLRTGPINVHISGRGTKNAQVSISTLDGVNLYSDDSVDWVNPDPSAMAPNTYRSHGYVFGLFAELMVGVEADMTTALNHL